jgi:hypothetical protein
MSPIAVKDNVPMMLPVFFVDVALVNAMGVSGICMEF